MVRKIHLGTDSAILDYLEARLTVVKEAAIARNKYHKSTVLRLRLATLQQFYSFFTLLIMMILGQPESGPPGIALPSVILPLRCLDLCPSPSQSFLHSPAH